MRAARSRRCSPARARTTGAFHYEHRALAALANHYQCIEFFQNSFESNGGSVASTDRPLTCSCPQPTPEAVYCFRVRNQTPLGRFISLCTAATGPRTDGTCCAAGPTFTVAVRSSACPATRLLHLSHFGARLDMNGVRFSDNRALANIDSDCAMSLTNSLMQNSSNAMMNIFNAATVLRGSDL